MNGQAERCDRTAYVSGLQSTITDIELFEVFNRVAHVEKVILRNGTGRHALVVFKTVQGLYQVLINFQGTQLHGRQLHIRPLRESSHANNEAITTMYEKARGSSGRRHSSEQQPHCSYSHQASSNNNNHQNPNPNTRNYRNSSGSSSSYGNQRRRGGGYGGYGYNRYNDAYNGRYEAMPLFDNHPVEQYSGYGGHNYHHGYHHHQYHHRYQHQHHHEPMQQQQQNLHFEDYAEGAKRFDNLANLIRTSTPTDPFVRGSPELVATSPAPRPRAISAKDFYGHSRQPPPTWKMELQIKNEMEQMMQKESDEMSFEGPQAAHEDATKPMTPQEFMAQIVMQTGSDPGVEKIVADGARKRNRNNLSVINPSLFYEQYPRTSSPVVTSFARPPSSTPHEANQSPNDPAVLAYSRHRIPQSAFDGLSPIDTNNCSFITKHLGHAPTADTMPRLHEDSEGQENRCPRDLTNDELSDMIVSTGNLRINPQLHVDSFDQIQDEEPAPWSPLKRLRAESGCGPVTSANLIASPQFSPIKPKEVVETMDSEEDDVFATLEKQASAEQVVGVTPEKPQIEQKMSTFEDINNSRLPSNSHSAAPSSDQKSFAFPPEYPMCRHSSVPSIAHLVGDLSDFCPPSPHIVNEKLHHQATTPAARDDGSIIDSTSPDDKTDEIQKTPEDVPIGI